MNFECRIYKPDKDGQLKLCKVISHKQVVAMRDYKAGLTGKLIRAGNRLYPFRCVICGEKHERISSVKPKYCGRICRNAATRERKKKATSASKRTDLLNL